ncbi:hypothetical protein MMC25_007859 [Agyrium rufum]|nr:hypothetical protein [Agyrium rufum]
MPLSILRYGALRSHLRRSQRWAVCDNLVAQLNTSARCSSEAGSNLHSFLTHDEAPFTPDASSIEGEQPTQITGTPLSSQFTLSRLRPKKLRDEIPPNKHEHENLLADQQLVRQRVLDALKENNSESILRYFAQASRHAAFPGIFNKTELAIIFDALQPDQFRDEFTSIGEDMRLLDLETLELYKEIYKDLNPNQVARLRDATPQLHDIFETYKIYIRDLMNELGRRLANLNYSVHMKLLNISRVIGDGASAQRLWRSMQKQHIHPGLTAYNYYMEAMTWTHMYDFKEQARLRVTKFNLKNRVQVRRVGDSRLNADFIRYEIGDFGLRQQMIKVFDDLVKQGVAPDSDTYMHLMVAMAREGDINGVKNVLRKVWQVDVDQLMLEEPQHSDSEIFRMPSIPLQANARLLYIIAHCFGSNNQISSAMRIVDYVSTTYHIDIDIKCWNELLNWTYILASPRSSKPEKEGDTVGKLPPSAISGLWRTMTSAPYNVKPTMPMYFRRIHNLWYRSYVEPMLTTIRKAQTLHEKQLRQYQTQLRDQLREMGIRINSVEELTDEVLNAALNESPALRLEKLKEHRDRAYMSRAFQYLLWNGRWTSRSGGSRRNLLWVRIGIMHAIERFGMYQGAPGYSYAIESGTVHLSRSQGPHTFQLLPGPLAINGVDAAISSWSRQHWKPSALIAHGEIGSAAWATFSTSGDSVGVEQQEDEEEGDEVGTHEQDIEEGDGLIEETFPKSMSLDFDDEEDYIPQTYFDDDEFY